MAAIRRYDEKDMDAFIRMCKAAYRKHNVFYKSKDEILSYLRKKDTESRDFGGLFFSYESEILIAGGLIKVEEIDMVGSHVRFRYNHVVGRDDTAKKEMLEFMDQRIKNLILGGLIASAKIEVAIAQGEKDKSFYLAEGFVEEGKLLDHYRKGEDVFLLGKGV